MPACVGDWETGRNYRIKFGIIPKLCNAKITLDLEEQKIYTTELGKQDFANLNLPVTIALINATGQKIYRQKHQLPQKKTTLELTVDKLPTTAAIDPDYILPSAFLQNNIKQIRAKN